MMISQDGAARVREDCKDAKIHRKMPDAFAGRVINGLIPPPLAVRSMLRTTTEMGDIDRLDCLMHLPRSGPQSAWTRPRSGSFDISFASASRYQSSPRFHYNGARAGSNPSKTIPLTRSRAAHSDLTTSDSRTCGASQRARMHGGLAQELASSGHTPHKHQSLTTLRSYAPSRFSNTCSSLQSRYLQPERGLGSPRASHRLSRTRRFCNTTAEDQGYPARSSMVKFGQRRIQKLCNVHDHLLPSTVNLPLPAFSLAPAAVQEVHRRECKHDPTLARHSRVPFDVQRGSHKELAGSTSQENIPFYYDYSESFLNDDHHSTTTEQLGPTNFQTNIMTNGLKHCQWNQRRAINVHSRSATLLAELPTEYNDPTREQSSMNSALNMFELDATETNRGVTPLTQLPLQQVSFAACISVKASQASPMKPRHAIGSRTASKFFPNVEKGQHDLTALVARVHSLEDDVSTRHAIGQSDRHLAEPDKAQDLVRSGLLPASIASSGKHQQSFEPDILETNDRELEKVVVRPWDAFQHILMSQSKQTPNPESRKQREESVGGAQTTKQEPAQSNGPYLTTSLLPRHGSNPVERGTGLAEDCLESLPQKNCGPAFWGTTMAPRSEMSSQKLMNSNVISYGTSTIDSLLDRHIESLGLMPEPGSPSDCLSACEPSLHDGCHDDSSLGGHLRSTSQNQNVTQAWPFDPIGRRASSLDSRMVSKYEPPQVVHGIARRCSINSEPAPTSTDSWYVKSAIGGTKGSIGWQTLPSTSCEQSQKQISKPSLTSGYMADIDTDVRMTVAQSWSYSQSTLSTSADGEFDCPRRRTWETTATKQKTQAKRRMGVHVRNQIPRSRSDDVLYCAPTTDISTGHAEPPLKALWPASLRSPTASGDLYLPPVVELYNKPFRTADHGSGQHQLYNHESAIPSRWSDIIAAMPLPGSNIQKSARKASTQTQRSQRSQRSCHNVVEPLNNSRRQAHVFHQYDTTPRLAPPDLGPPLDVSTLNLSVPYAEIPSTICPSPHNARSLFDNSSTRFFRKRFRSRFGFNSLHSALYESEAAFLPGNLGKLEQNDEVRNARGPYPGEIYYMSDSSRVLHAKNATSSCAYRKKRLVKKLKRWWKSAHCSRTAKLYSIETETSTCQNLGSPPI